MNQKSNIPKDKEFYQNNYILLNKTSYEIAYELNCSQTEVHKYIKRFNLQKDKSLVYKGINLGSKNGMWKGDKAGLMALHEWVRNRKPKPNLCENCKKVHPYDLANISGKYKRDINDFEWLCRDCHMKKDGRLKELNSFNTSRKRKHKGNKFICNMCSTYKDPIEFSKDKYNPDGYSMRCKECEHKYRKKIKNEAVEKRHKTG